MSVAPTSESIQMLCFKPICNLQICSHLQTIIVRNKTQIFLSNIFNCEIMYKNMANLVEEKVIIQESDKPSVEGANIEIKPQKLEPIPNLILLRSPIIIRDFIGQNLVEEVKNGTYLTTSTFESLNM